MPHLFILLILLSGWLNDYSIPDNTPIATPASIASKRENPAEQLTVSEALSEIVGFKIGIGKSHSRDTGKIILPKIFSTGMVLQRETNIPVWGWAKAGKQITVQLNNQQQTAKANASGRWKLHLKPENAGGPFKLIISSEQEKIVLEDVLIGDVWVCSGQSNMAFTVKRSMNAEVEIKHAQNQMIRQFHVRQAVSLQPKEDVAEGQWKTCTIEEVGNFTAVGYFFARDLLKEIKVPVGLINSTVGGTHIETWISRDAYQEDAYYREMIAKLPSASIEQLIRQQVTAMQRRIDSIQGGLPTRKEKDKWTTLSYNDSNWSVMEQAGMWEPKGWQKLDGKVWFRKIIDVPATDTGQTVQLELGVVDDTDETYVNGIRIGSVRNKPSQERTYTIAGGILKPGRNVIAVNIEDVGGGGGFGSKADKLKLRLAHSVIPLGGAWSYKIDTFYRSGFNVNPNIYPALLFNAMINPLTTYPIKGVLWYQGESNTWRAYEYRRTFPLLIKDWRKKWNQGNFPFLFVQLPNFSADPGNVQKGSTWAELREAQQLALGLPNTGMAVTIDVGNATDIHPNNKQEVGRRLAQIALNKVYGTKTSFLGPTFKRLIIKGDKAIVTFNNSGNGFLIKGPQNDIKGFAIAGDDSVFYNAKAFVDGMQITVAHEQVKKPVAVRYAWSDNPEGLSLYNKEGYPAAPFRTDTWNCITGSRFYRIAD